MKGEVEEVCADSDRIGMGMYSVENAASSTAVDGVEALGIGLADNDDTHAVVAAIDTVDAPNKMVVKVVHTQVNTTAKVIAAAEETIAFIAQTKSINDGTVIDEQALVRATQINNESMMICPAPRSGAATKRKIVSIENTDIPMGESSNSASKTKKIAAAASNKVMPNERHGEELTVTTMDSDHVGSSSNTKRIRRGGELVISSSSTGSAAATPPPAFAILDTEDKCTVVHTDRSTQIVSIVSEFKKKHCNVLDGEGFPHSSLMQLWRAAGRGRDNKDLRSLLSTFLVVASQEVLKDFNSAMEGGKKTVQWLIEAEKLSQSRYLRYNLGFYYEHGLGVDVNYLKAVEMYKLSADQGYGPAKGRLGYCYMKGHGATQSNTAALEYLKQSANTAEKLRLKWGQTIQKLEEQVTCSAPNRFLDASSATQEKTKSCKYHPKSKSHWTEECRDGMCRPVVRSKREVLVLPPVAADEGNHDHIDDEGYHDSNFSSGGRYSTEKERQADEYCDRRGEISSYRNYVRCPVIGQLRNSR